MIIEHKTKGHIEMRGTTKNGRIATIESMEVGYIVKGYEVKETDYSKTITKWGDALAIFNSITKKH
jgi:hypothetical protein